MGGVDLADFRRLKCNTTIMGLHRWWLKLFFYLLDVGTANAYVTYKMAMDKHDMTLMQFKLALIQSLVGHKMSEILPEPTIDHQLVRNLNDERKTCVYCYIFHTKTKWTRYHCAHPRCMLPLCSIGHGRSGSDCFALGHANEQVRLAMVQRHKKMMQKANNPKYHK